MPLPAYSEWEPACVDELKRQLNGLDWILAGGYALALFVGGIYRSHEDIDILVARQDQSYIYQVVNPSLIYVAEKPGQLVETSPDRFYGKPIQDFWVLKENQESWSYQIMLFDSVDGYWEYKRNPQIKLPLSQITLRRGGIQLIRPEIQLLYKSNHIRSKDQLDFDIIWPELDLLAKQWLQTALKQCYTIHPWIK